MTHTKPGRALLNKVDHLLHESLTYTRTLITDLNSAHLHQSGLLAVLKYLAEKMKQFNLQVIIEVEPPIPDLTEDQQYHLYWSIRESLFNIVKHAQVNQARILMQPAAGPMLQFIVSDAGKGFEPEKAGMAHSGEHYGLFGMRGRMATLQGNITIHSSPGQGTRVILSIPLPPSSRLESASTNSQGS